MKKFDFLIGSWHLDYTIPKNAGTGIGTFKRALDDKYVFFDYSTSSETGETGAAHGIFAWDEKVEWLSVFLVDPGVFIIPKERPWKTLKEFVEAAKTKKMRTINCISTMR